MTYLIFSIIAFQFLWLFAIERHIRVEIDRISKYAGEIDMKIILEYSECNNEKIISMRRFIENQDALITALWQNSIGCKSAGVYDGRELIEYLGVKPDWHPHEREWAGPIVYFSRNDRYPWGTYAESLHYSE